MKSSRAEPIFPYGQVSPDETKPPGRASPPPAAARRTSDEALSAWTNWLFLTFGWLSSHIKTMKDPNDSFHSTVLLLRNIGETHDWEISVTDQGEKPMSRFTFRGSRREAEIMAIEARLSFEVKLEAIARNAKARPGTGTARANS